MNIAACENMDSRSARQLPDAPLYGIYPLLDEVNFIKSRAHALSVGDKPGHYEILSLLGQGGMGEVYRARDATLKRDMALRVLPAALLGEPDRHGSPKAIRGFGFTRSP